MFYPSIISSHHDVQEFSVPYPDNCRGKGPYTYTKDAGKPPPSVDRFYEPSSEFRWKTPLPPLRESFSKIKQSGLIKMTNYNVGRRITRDYLAQGELEQAVHTWGAISCGSGRNEQVSLGSPTMLVSKWVEQWDLSYMLKKRPDAPYYRVDTSADLGSEISQVQNAVVSDSLSQMDALTEAAEGPELIKLIASMISSARKPLQAYKDLKKDLSSLSSASDRIMDAWMQYRYAVMPIMYSINDAVDLYEKRKDIYKTSRAGDNVSRKVSAKPSNLPGYCFFEELDETISIRATGKARYSTSSLRLTDQLSINPIVTAWELIPYSFVVDWFLNIGDWLQSQTSSLVDLSSQRQFCYSVKTNRTVSTFYKNDSQNSYSRTYGPNDPYGRSGTFTHEWNNGAIHHMRDEIEESYRRVVFTPNDISLAFNSGGINHWKRKVDAAVISLRSGTSALRRLRSS